MKVYVMFLQYTFNAESGEWLHRNYHRAVRSLSQIDVTTSGAKIPSLDSMKQEGKVDIKVIKS